jgi:hypothetical protein
VQGVCYFANKIPKFIKKEVNVENINSKLRVKRYIFKIRGASAMIE